MHACSRCNFTQDSCKSCMIDLASAISRRPRRARPRVRCAPVGGARRAAASGAFERAARKLHLDPSVLRGGCSRSPSTRVAPIVTGRGKDLRLTPLGARIRTVSSEMLDRAAAMHTHDRSARAHRHRLHRGRVERAPSAGGLRAARRATGLSIAVRAKARNRRVRRAPRRAREVDLGVVRGVAIRRAVATRARRDAPRTRSAVDGREARTPSARACSHACVCETSRASRSSSTARRPPRGVA